jgi:hypothetical protein
MCPTSSAFHAGVPGIDIPKVVVLRIHSFDKTQ